MVIGQFHGIAQIQIHRRGAIEINLPHPVIPLPINLPNNHAIGVRGVGDTLTQLLRIILGRRPRNIIILLRVTPDLLDRLVIRLPTKLAGHPLVRIDAHRHHMHQPVRILQISGIRRHHNIHRVHRLEPHPLVARIPEALHHPAPAHQGVIDPTQHLIHEIGLIPNLVIEPVLSHPRIRIQLLAHRNKAGHYIHPQCLLEEQWLELLDRRIDERPMQIRGLGPWLIGPAQPMMAQLIPPRLPQLPRTTLANSLDYLAL